MKELLEMRHREMEEFVEKEPQEQIPVTDEQVLQLIRYFDGCMGYWL